ALEQNPDHIHALRGRGRTLMQLERYDEALDAFDMAIAHAPEVGFTYANRGILYDRMGEYELAIRDYEQAMTLDPETTEGPNWLTRFLRLQPDKPPGIAERAAYLRAELAKPEDQRVLRVPEIDDAQRPYQQ
ncbi:MAG: tetratricopeptide repeat protein, partial [Gammaproteobacteria bacterium]|nr:tetratricopeptide repeat protein [Gammaproteobacteria bacterium]